MDWLDWNWLGWPLAVIGTLMLIYVLVADGSQPIIIVVGACMVGLGVARAGVEAGQ